MPIFDCDKCHCVENTALCNYFLALAKDKKLCSLCDPSIGKWHNFFPRTPSSGLVLASDGFLYEQAYVESQQFQQRIAQGLKIIKVL